jgi:hypothetical protein
MKCEAGHVDPILYYYFQHDLANMSTWSKYYVTWHCEMHSFLEWVHTSSEGLSENMLAVPIRPLGNSPVQVSYILVFV